MLYLAAIIILTNLISIAEVYKAFLILPFFIIIPFYVGLLFLRLISYKFEYTFKSKISSLISAWIIGAFLVFVIGFISAQIPFGIFIASILVLVMATFGKLFRPKNLFATNFSYSSLFLILLIIIVTSILPLIVIYSNWSFPLKYDSDGLLYNMVSLNILNNQLNLPSLVHLPFESILLSLPSFIFGVAPYSLQWAAPFLIYPIFALGVFLISYKVSDNILLGLASAAVSVWFTGGFYTVSDLFMVLPRDLATILFLFGLVLLLENKNDFGEASKQGIINLALLGLLFSMITISLSPSLNHLPSYFLPFILLFCLLCPIAYYLFSKKARYFSLCFIPFAIFLISFLVTDIAFPLIDNVTFFVILVGLISVILLPILLSKFSLKPSVLIVFGLVGLIIYDQIWFFFMFLLTITVIIWLRIRKDEKLVNVTRICLLIFLVITIILYFIGTNSVWCTPYNFISLQGLFLINHSVGSTIMLLFFMGFLLLTFFVNDEKMLLLQLICAIFLVFVFLNPVQILNARLLNFIIPLLSLFVVYPFFAFYSNLSSHFPGKKRLRFSNITHYAIPFLVFMLVMSPFISVPVLDFVNTNNKQNLPLNTFNDVDYKTAVYIRNHFESKNVLIISDTFSSLIYSGLSGNSFSLGFRVPYDEIGNTHLLVSDANYVTDVQTLLSTTDVSLANDSFSNIHTAVESSLELNQKLGVVNFSSDITYLVVLNGRTSEWLTQGSNDAVVYPQDMTWLSGYQKFIDQSYSHLIYEYDDEVFIFEISRA